MTWESLFLMLLHFAPALVYWWRRRANLLERDWISIIGLAGAGLLTFVVLMSGIADSMWPLLLVATYGALVWLLVKVPRGAPEN